MLHGNTPTQSRNIRRPLTILLVAVVGVNLAYWGWRWATHETYESCLKDAARAAGGLVRAYADLREICDERETARQFLQTPAAKRELTDADVFPPSSAREPAAGTSTKP